MGGWLTAGGLTTLMLVTEPIDTLSNVSVLPMRTNPDGLEGLERTSGAGGVRAPTERLPDFSC